MKKSIRRKLALSALSVGVALLSVTATTYAWFTTNTTATATGVQGTASSLDTSLLIGKAENGTFGAKLELDPVSNVKLKPLQWTSEGLKNLANNAATYTDSQHDYVSYTIFFKVTDLTNAKPKDLTLKITDLNKDLTNEQTQGDQVLVADAAESTATNYDNYKAGQTISGIKLVDSLSLEVGTLTKVTTDAAVTVAKTSDVQTKGVFNYTADAPTDYDSLIYYNNVMGTTAARTSDATQYNTNALWNGTDGNEIRLLTLTNTSEPAASKEVVFSLTFNIYLNGWDKDNFNAVAAKQFVNGFEFKLVDHE